jgi:hypothetical protein
LREGKRKVRLLGLATELPVHSKAPAPEDAVFRKAGAVIRTGGDLNHQSKTTVTSMK